MPLIEVGVEALPFQQFGMGAALHNASVLDNQNLIGFQNRRKAMRDDDRGSTRERNFKGALNRRLGLRVEMRGGFVENDNIRRLEKKTRNCEALLFTSREAIAALAHQRV